jgi:hypothetical protein
MDYRYNIKLRNTYFLSFVFLFCICISIKNTLGIWVRVLVFNATMMRSIAGFQENSHICRNTKLHIGYHVNSDTSPNTKLLTGFHENYHISPNT